MGEFGNSSGTPLPTKKRSQPLHKSSKMETRTENVPHPFPPQRHTYTPQPSVYDVNNHRLSLLSGHTKPRRAAISSVQKNPRVESGTPGSDCGSSASVLFSAIELSDPSVPSVRCCGSPKHFCFRGQSRQASGMGTSSPRTRRYPKR